MAFTRCPMGSAPARGFTMVELMVTVVVMAVLLTMAVPSFQGVVNGNRLAGASNEMMASLQAARMEAVKRNARVVFCLSATAKTSTPTCAASGNIDGWIVFVDANKNNAYNSAGDTLLRTATVSSNVVVKSSATPAGVVVYRSDGFARTSAGALLNGAIDACIVTTRPPQNARHVIIGAGSRVSIASAPATNCPIPADKP